MNFSHFHFVARRLLKSFWQSQGTSEQKEWRLSVVPTNEFLPACCPPKADRVAIKSRNLNFRQKSLDFAQKTPLISLL